MTTHRNQSNRRRCVGHHLLVSTTKNPNIIETLCSDEGLCQRFLFCYRFIRKCGPNNVAGDLTRRLISSILCSGSLHTMGLLVLILCTFILTFLIRLKSYALKICSFVQVPQGCAYLTYQVTRLPLESSKLKHTAFERPSVCLSLDSLLEDMVADWDNLILRHHILDCISNQQVPFFSSAG